MEDGQERHAQSVDVDMTAEMRRRAEELKARATQHYENYLACQGGAEALFKMLEEAQRRANDAAQQTR